VLAHLPSALIPNPGMEGGGCGQWCPAHEARNAGAIAVAAYNYTAYP